MDVLEKNPSGNVFMYVFINMGETLKYAQASVHYLSPAIIYIVTQGVVLKTRNAGQKVSVTCREQPSHLLLVRLRQI